MSAFQDMVMADRDIFLNRDEFASVHRVDGKEITCLLQNEDMDSASGFEGLGKNAISIQAKTEDMPGARISGDSLNVDGRDYTILRWDEAEGMATVMLYIPVAYGYAR